ncbi:DUF2975 domain-containing protein [Gracilibacillus phocaeensis]|uniref:DUF2975 domain-containing protein n=1 Tax=Gracilibacillus phocaeensis TaxID=2042304 RepID=UPI00102F6726|nr:DUF2975 domain-containing protein [Gracilibacillus phocaeensis]
MVKKKVSQLLPQRSGRMITLLNVVKWFTLVFLVYTIGEAIWSLFLPASAFEAESGVNAWRIDGPVVGNLLFSAYIPFDILLSVGQYHFEAKHAFITYVFFNGLTFSLPLLYGIRQIKTILASIAEGRTPFSDQNVKCLQRLALILFLYGIFGKLIINLAMSVFVTQIVSISLSMIISYSALIAGLLFFVVAQIFQYGTYLQKEMDETV